MAPRKTKKTEPMIFDNGIAKEVRQSNIEDFVEENYLPFAWSVCLDRALTLLDGLKPIQRKILYTAYLNKVTDKSTMVKSSTFEGKVMEFSPHGGSYGSIVNIASSEGGGQPRSIRVPLIRGKGNWGGIESPAAACFVGDTKIQIADSEDLTIKEIYDKFQEEEKPSLYAYACSLDGEVHIREITGASFEGEKEVWRVTFDDDTFTECTGDHRFLLRSGEYEHCQNLMLGDGVMAINDDHCSSSSRKVVGVSKLNKKEKVYDIEVEEFHNFALSAGGVFVHNSRYTELRLWPAAMELLKELDEDTVEMVPNYNNTKMEPVYLPVRWPVAIINGVTDAMAVGFACNLPSHNPNEIMDATIALVENPKMTVEDIMKIVHGPDFDCGCDIIACTEKDGQLVNGIESYMKTGSGTFIMKAPYELEEDNGKYTISFKKLPYKVSPEKIVEELRSKYEKGDFKELAYFDDLSDRKNPVNVVIETKKNINIGKVIADLYKKTSLQCTFSANNTIVVDNRPVKLDIKSILEEFIKLRKECTKKKLNYRLNKKQDELKLQEAVASVLVDIDKCISIIRKSEDDKKAKDSLVKSFKLDGDQADYILRIQLRRLTKADIHEVKAKVASLKKEIKEIQSTLSSEKKMKEFIIGELKETKEIIASPRKCKITKTMRGKKEEEKDVYLVVEGGKAKRTFNKSDEAFKTDKDGHVLVITKDAAYVRSIYELQDEKFSALSKFKVKGKPLAVGTCEGYLILVGAGGNMKAVDMNDYKFPRKDTIPKILGQEVVFATFVKKLEGELVIDSKRKNIALKDLVVQGLTANGRREANAPVGEVTYKAK